jgi:hypothetical protein
MRSRLALALGGALAAFALAGCSSGACCERSWGTYPSYGVPTYGPTYTTVGSYGAVPAYGTGYADTYVSPGYAGGTYGSAAYGSNSYGGSTYGPGVGASAGVSVPGAAVGADASLGLPR